MEAEDINEHAAYFPAMNRDLMRKLHFDGLPRGTFKFAGARHSFPEPRTVNKKHIVGEDDQKAAKVFDTCNPRNFLVLIKAGAKAKYQERRKVWRDSSCPGSYHSHGVPYRFMLAMPAHEIIDPNSHNFSKMASEEEISDMKTLLDESIAHGDVEFLSLKDIYEDFHLKTVRMLEWAVDRGMTDDTSIVVLQDDDFCLRPRVLREICEEALAPPSNNSSLYAGSYLWDDPDFGLAFDGSRAPYFSGNLYALSADLVRDIVFDPRTYFTSMNVTNAEDKQAGWWVKNQAGRRDVKFVEDRSLSWAVERDQEQEKEHSDKGSVAIAPATLEKGSRVSCGNHYAPNCDGCPQGHGRSWCNGDCEWWGWPSKNTNTRACRLRKRKTKSSDSSAKDGAAESDGNHLQGNASNVAKADG